MFFLLHLHSSLLFLLLSHIALHSPILTLAALLSVSLFSLGNVVTGGALALHSLKLCSKADAQLKSTFLKYFNEGQTVATRAKHSSRCCTVCRAFRDSHRINCTITTATATRMMIPNFCGAFHKCWHLWRKLM